MRKCLYILGIIFLLASCEKNPAVSSEGQPIYLRAFLSEIYQTKTPYEGTTPTMSNPLNVDVWASTTADIFKNEGWTGHDDGKGHKGMVSIHTQGHFQSGDPQLLSQAIYPVPESGNVPAPVYFVSMHPQSTEDKAWTTPSSEENKGKIASYTFTGCEDLMFAPQVSGTYDTGDQGQIVTNSPTLAFKHLLTRFTVKMGITLGTGENLMDVQNAWGPVTDLKIQAYNSQSGALEALNTVTIDLTKGESFSYDSDLAYSYVDKTNPNASSIGSCMDFYSIGKDVKFPEGNSYVLTDQKPELAYVMCAPVEASAEDGMYEYLLTVTTQKRGEQEIILDLKNTDATYFSGSTRGKHFGITLNFKKGSAIVTVVNVNEWENGGYGSGDIED